MDIDEQNKVFTEKALVVTTVASTLDQFCMHDITLLQQKYEVHVAANFQFGNNTPKERLVEFENELLRKEIKVHDISFNRKPITIENIKSYIKIREIMNNGNFKVIHCHTPVAAMLVRLAAGNVRKKDTMVMYTAHGFHFYKGAPLLNWLVYYPIESALSKNTDVLITINKEDYQRASNSFKIGKVVQIPGVGIDVEVLKKIEIDKRSKRKELGLPPNSFIILSVGELNKNKNHELVIKALKKINNPEIHFILCGQGILSDHLKELTKKLNLQNNVHILGFRKDIAEIYKASDIFAFPSFREGLSVALMEAMACGLPVICSDIRGNSDLIENGKGGFLVEPDKVEDFWMALEELYKSKSLRNLFREYNLKRIENHSTKHVNEIMKEIYQI